MKSHNRVGAILTIVSIICTTFTSMPSLLKGEDKLPWRLKAGSYLRDRIVIPIVQKISSQKIELPEEETLKKIAASTKDNEARERLSIQNRIGLAIRDKIVLPLAEAMTRGEEPCEADTEWLRQRAWSFQALQALKASYETMELLSYRGVQRVPRNDESSPTSNLQDPRSTSGVEEVGFDHLEGGLAEPFVHEKYNRNKSDGFWVRTATSIYKPNRWKLAPLVRAVVERQIFLLEQCHRKKVKHLRPMLRALKHFLKIQEIDAGDASDDQWTQAMMKLRSEAFEIPYLADRAYAAIKADYLAWKGAVSPKCNLDDLQKKQLPNLVVPKSFAVEYTLPSM